MQTLTQSESSRERAVRGYSGTSSRRRRAVPPVHAQLKCLRASQTEVCALFGGAPLEDARWSVIATSVPFDRRAWPFPQFSARGAFGRTWTKDTYDSDTMQVVQRERIDQAAAQALPDSRFASAWELETLLRERLCGIPPGAPFAVYEVHTGFDPNALDVLARGGRVQFSEPLSADDLQHLAQFIECYPDVEIRVHGFSTRPFDLRSLAAFQALRALTIQTGRLEGTGALEALRSCGRLRVGPLDRPATLPTLSSLPDLCEIEVRGRHTDLRAVAACSHLTALALIDVPAMDLGALACREVLADLTIAHCAAQSRTDRRNCRHWPNFACAICGWTRCPTSRATPPCARSSFEESRACATLPRWHERRCSENSRLRACRNST